MLGLHARQMRATEIPSDATLFFLAYPPQARRSGNGQEVRTKGRTPLSDLICQISAWGPWQAG